MFYINTSEKGQLKAEMHNGQEAKSHGLLNTEINHMLRLALMLSNRKECTYQSCVINLSREDLLKAAMHIRS